MKNSTLLAVFIILFLRSWDGIAQNKPEITGKGILEDIRHVSIQAFLFYSDDLEKALHEALDSGKISKEDFRIYNICFQTKKYRATRSFTECASFSSKELKDEGLPWWLKRKLAHTLTTSYFKMGMLDKGEEAREYYYSLESEVKRPSGGRYTEYMLSAEFYYDAKEFETAAKKYKESLHDHISNAPRQNYHYKGFLSNNIAQCYLELKMYDSVMHYTQLARGFWRVANTSLSKDYYNALLDANVALVYSSQGREKEAVSLLYHYMKGCEYRDYHHYIKSFVYLADVYVALKKYDKAQGILDSLDLVVGLPVLESKVLLHKYFTHYRIMNSTGEHEKAENYISRYLNLSEEIYKENKRKELKQYALMYDIQEKQQQLEHSKLENLKSKKIQDEQRLIIWIVVLICLVILVLCVLFFIRYKFQKEIAVLGEESKELAERSLHARETMLREVHHRVKNNLNTINGLFHLQLKTAQNEELKEQLQTSANRVFSIAQIHNMLYEESFLENVNMKEYIKVLCSHLMKTSNSDIDLTLDVDSINLNMDYALPLGLVLNELFTNSIKHAFRDVEKGAIGISLKAKGNEFTLKYKDNGPGYDLNQDSDSLGLKLVLMMKKQLSAEVLNNAENSSELVFKFNVLA